MSKKNKPQKQRVYCPICFEEDPKTPIELQVQKTIRKVSHHPIVITKAAELQIDYGFTINHDSSAPSFKLKCPRCKLEQDYPTPIALLESVASIVDEKDYGVQAKFPIVKIDKYPKTKEKEEEEELPRIVRISNATADAV